MAWACQRRKWPARPFSSTSTRLINPQPPIVPIRILGKYVAKLVKVLTKKNKNLPDAFLNIRKFKQDCLFAWLEYDKLECTDKYFDCPRYSKVCKTSSINGVSLNILCPRTCRRCPGSFLFVCFKAIIKLTHKIVLE